MLVFWALFYLVAPLFEEPWLEQRYGSAFETYKSRVPRFVGWIIFRRKLDIDESS